MGRSRRHGRAHRLDGDWFRRFHAPHGSLHAQRFRAYATTAGLQRTRGLVLSAIADSGGPSLMFPPRQDVLRVVPEFFLCLSGILLMLIEPFLSRARRNLLVTFAALGSGLALVS